MDEEEVEIEVEEQEDIQVCCTGCMNCLGLTWADFL